MMAMSFPREHISSVMKFKTPIPYMVLFETGWVYLNKEAN